jgi:TPR repeat protein
MKTSSLILGATVAAFLAIHSANAGPFEEAVAAYESGDYQTAFQKFMPAAESGNADAQVNVGAMYANGEGVAQNFDEALKWYRLAAEQGNAAAQNRLGSMYDDGVGVAQNYEEAAKWYRRSAEQGNIGAQINLGVMYAKGVGVPKDYVLAYMWLSIAASRVLPDANDMRVFVARLRDQIAVRMAPFQIDEARQLTRQWKPKIERQAAQVR